MQNLEELIRKYNAGSCSAEEKAVIEQWYQFFDWHHPPAGISDIELARLKEDAWLAIKNKKTVDTPAKIIEGAFPVVRRLRKWPYYAAASIVLLLAAIVLYQFYFTTNKPAVVPVAETPKTAPDLPPGASKATLILANGRVVSLDSVMNASLTENDGTRISQGSGTLTYNGIVGGADEILFNTLSVPRGGEYQLAMSDGTKVWLNAASSLRFPTRFAGKERLVYLSGEAYFEVAKNTKMPFRVMTEDDMMVEALGTHFDIMAYNDERAVKTSLAEGSVRVTKQSDTVLLKPSTMAVWQKDNRKLSVDEADLEKVLAWKNGMIEFREDDLPSIMRQISRWYDVDIHFTGHEPKGRYNGSIQRQAKLSLVLEILKEAGVECNLQGRKLEVEED
ncbi:MAG: FecR family protein [Flavitalea sp.]